MGSDKTLNSWIHLCFRQARRRARIHAGSRSTWLRRLIWAYPSHVSLSQMEVHRRPQWHGPMAVPPMRAHPSHGSWPRMGLTRRPQWQGLHGGCAPLGRTLHSVRGPAWSTTGSPIGVVDMAAPPHLGAFPAQSWPHMVPAAACGWLFRQAYFCPGPDRPLRGPLGRPRGLLEFLDVRGRPISGARELSCVACFLRHARGGLHEHCAHRASCVRLCCWHRGYRLEAKGAAITSAPPVSGPSGHVLHEQMSFPVRHHLLLPPPSPPPCCSCLALVRVPSCYPSAFCACALAAT